MKPFKCVPYSERFSHAYEIITPVSGDPQDLLKLFGLPEQTIEFVLYAPIGEIYRIHCRYYEDQQIKEQEFALIRSDD